MDEETVLEVKQLVVKTDPESTGTTLRIKDETARDKTSNALYYTEQNLNVTQKNQVYTNLNLKNCATLEFVVVGSQQNS